MVSGFRPKPAINFGLPLIPTGWMDRVLQARGTDDHTAVQQARVVSGRTGGHGVTGTHLGGIHPLVALVQDQVGCLIEPPQNPLRTARAERRSAGSLCTNCQATRLSLVAVDATECAPECASERWLTTHNNQTIIRPRTLSVQGYTRLPSAKQHSTRGWGKRIVHVNSPSRVLGRTMMFLPSLVMTEI